MAAPPNRPRGRVPADRNVHLRRRAVAIGVAGSILIALIGVVRGDSGSPFKAPGSKTAAQRDQLPWLRPFESGAAGPLDGEGLPSPAAQAAAVARYYRIGKPIYCAGARGNYAALTFDDGPSQYSQQFLAQLRKADARATFFDVGQLVADSKGAPRQQDAIGGVGNHTWRHPFLTQLSRADVVSEISRTNQVLANELGRPMTLFRSPYEAHNPEVDGVVHQFGLLQILWDVDTRDSAGAPAAEIATNTEQGLRPGAIILAHETYDRTLAALPNMLAAAKKKGIRLVSVPALLALDPPPETLVRAGPDACSDRERYQREEDANAMRLGSSSGTAGGTSTTTTGTTATTPTTTTAPAT
jgi:peptidoglycan/xylan/chitin deacetylase (PgdA/CDA1 family)